MDKKVCTKCVVEKALVEFSRRASEKSGFHYTCKSCQSLSAKKYNEANKEKIAIRGKYWREANKEVLALRKKKWREANKEYVKIYYEANRERILDLQRKNRKENPSAKKKIRETRKIKCEQWHKDNVENIPMKKKCYCCGVIKSINQYPKAKDRKDLHKGRCKDCNNIVSNRRSKENCKRLTDVYIRNYLKQYVGIPFNYITTELIEVKRIQLLIKRELKG